MKLQDKVAIVVGGGSGIGRVSATLMAQEGAKVMVVDLSVERANMVSDNIKAMGLEATAIKMDMRNEDETRDMVGVTLRKYGKIDILVNVAGGSFGEFILESKEVGYFYESTREKWDRLLETNLTGVRNCTRSVINHMIERHSGKIIFFSSIAAVRGIATGVDYAAAKAGLFGFAKALAVEMEPHNVQVNCITPVGTLSERLLAGLERIRQAGQEADLSKYCTPEEVAEAVIFLSSAGSDHMSGQNIIFGTPNSP